MYIYVYIHMYIHIYICIYICIYVYIIHKKSAWRLVDHKRDHWLFQVRAVLNFWKRRSNRVRAFAQMEK